MQLFEHQKEALTSDDYYTPSWLFEDMGVEFDLDVASPPGGVPWIPAKRFLTMADDGLYTPWVGRVWMNPPYSKPAPWVARFIEHGNGIALLPFTKSKWNNLLWNNSAAGTVLITASFKFGNNSDESIMLPVALWAIGGWAVDAIARVGYVR